MTNKKYDIIIIGAGAIGLSFALSLADTKLNILIIDKAKEGKLANPEYDGRETGLTNFSVSLLKQLDIWQNIDKKYISSLKEAKVINDNSNYSLDFKSKKSHNDILGYFISNHIIRKTLYQKVAKISNIKILTEANILDIENQPNLVRVILSDNKTLQGDLLVVADSRFSEARKKLGISTNMRDFARTMIVCKMEHKKPHNNIAFECFDKDRVLAVLPLSGNFSSIVITLPISNAQNMLDIQEKDFNQDISQRFAKSLGELKLVSKRYSYPLISTYASKFCKNRAVLIGDAAVGMHPVTAHGFNIGIKGQYILAKEIKKALNLGQDIASLQLLNKYNLQHVKDTKPLYYATNAIVSLFTTNNSVTKILRNVTLKVANNNFLPFKNIIIQHLLKKQNNFLDN
jgi:ubiquinone biosynthesis UbiH/UbiF/VisC/COQ6 family hydroxylase